MVVLKEPHVPMLTSQLLLKTCDHICNIFFKKLTIQLAGNHSVHHPFLFGGGVEPPTKFSKKGGLDMTLLLEGVAGKEGGDFIQVGGGGVQFSHKNKSKYQNLIGGLEFSHKKIKCKIFNDKNSLQAKNIFFCRN